MILKSRCSVSWLGFSHPPLCPGSALSLSTYLLSVTPLLLPFLIKLWKGNELLQVSSCLLAALSFRAQYLNPVK